MKSRNCLPVSGSGRLRRNADHVGDDRRAALRARRSARRRPCRSRARHATAVIAAATGRSPDNQRIGDVGAAGPHQHVLLRELLHELLAVDALDRGEPVQGGRGRGRVGQGELALPFRIEQILPGLGCLLGADHLGVVGHRHGLARDRSGVARDDELLRIVRELRAVVGHQHALLRPLRHQHRDGDQDGRGSAPGPPAVPGRTSGRHCWSRRGNTPRGCRSSR